LTWMADHDATARPAWSLVIVCCLAVFLLATPADASRVLPDLLAPTIAGPVAGLANLDQGPPVRPTHPFFSAADIVALSYGYDGPDHLLSLTSGGMAVGHHLFQGLWTDPVTGISYARNRWYDARTASWLSEDPKGAVDSPNLYAFALLAPHLFTDPFGLSALMENPNWHHMLPLAVFEGRSKGRPPVVADLGLTLADDVGVHSSEYGRIIDRPEHTGTGANHRKYNAAFENELLEWRAENPKATVLTKADVNKILSELPDEMREFNQRGVKTELSYSDWRSKVKKQAELKRVRFEMENRKSRFSGRRLKVRAAGWLQAVAGATSLASGEIGANRYRDELRLRYQTSGYSDEEINALFELREKLEYRALEEISWPVQFRNPDYDPRIEGYLRSVPEDVILPDEDVPNLRVLVGEETPGA